MGHSFLFKVQVKQGLYNQYEPSFKVARVCSDPSIIEKFKTKNYIPKRIKNVSEPEFYSIETNLLTTLGETIEDLKDSKVV